MSRFKTIFRQFLAFNRYLIPYWSLEALVLVLVFLSSFLGLLGPYLSRVTIDQAFGHHDLYLFHMLLLFGFILFLFQGSLAVIHQYLSAYIGRRLTFDLRSDYTRHLFHLSYSDLHRRSTGEQIYRLGSDIDTVSTLATDAIPRILSTSVHLIFLLAICFYLNWQLTLFTLLVSPLFYLQARYFGKKQKKLTWAIKGKAQETLAGLQDSLSNIKLIKVLGEEKGAGFHYLRQRIALIRLNLALVRVSIFGNTFAGLLNTVTLTGFTYYIGYNVIKGYVSLGTLVALMIYLVQLFSSLKSLGGFYRSIMVKFVSWERVRETLDLTPERESPAAAALPALRGEIEYQGVDFGYRPAKLILKNIRFRIEAGEYVGLVGPSGSGKTTLLLLLLRLFRPGRGRINIDGYDLNLIRRRSLQPFLGAALQEAYLLNRTIRENLTFGAGRPPEAELWRALELADIENPVREMAQGLDTIVGEEGSNLSEGQRQRLNIARAVVGRPRILILDEATSAVGFDSEKTIFTRLREELPESTIIVATHRLLSLKDADRILVLKEGELLEEGDHQSLLRHRGFYGSLIDDQLDRREK